MFMAICACTEVNNRSTLLQRPLPELLDDYDGSLGATPWKEEGSEGIAIVSEKDFTNIFERLVNYVSIRDGFVVKSNLMLKCIHASHTYKDVKQATFPYKYNDAALAKLGMGPLWKEIMTNILPVVGASGSYTFVRENPPKLALFSGHDTTLMPIRKFFNFPLVLKVSANAHHTFLSSCHSWSRCMVWLRMVSLCITAHIRGV